MSVVISRTYWDVRVHVRDGQVIPTLPWGRGYTAHAPRYGETLTWIDEDTFHCTVFADWATQAAEKARQLVERFLEED